jgi:putative lipoprotein
VRPLALAAALLTASSPALATPPLASPPPASPALSVPPDPDPWLGHDKALHFSVAAAIAGAGYGLSALYTSDLRVRAAFGGGVSLAAGAGKELLDLAGFGDPSWRDFAWDVIGAVVGVGIAVSIDSAARGLHPGTAAPR